MERSEILRTLKGIMEDVFDVAPLSISESTVASDVEQWDSLNHIQLVVGVEKHYKVKFTSKEIQDWKNVGDICSNILFRLKGN